MLRQKFFNRSAEVVAKELLGKFLVQDILGKEYAYMITETEAYEGFEDKASHAHRGKTKRNEVMFRGAGRIYIYLVYGSHHILNIVTGREEYPAAVLIRGLEGVTGPGRLTKKLNISTKLNTRMLGKQTGLWVEDRGVEINDKDIIQTPRIGVEYAGDEWAKKPLRFVRKD